MSIKVLFFGAIRDLIGETEIVLPLTFEIRTKDAVLHITERFTLLKDRKLLCALNEHYAIGEEILKDGDELAIFTAVSGG